MKLKIVLVATLALMMAGSLVVDSRVRTVEAIESSEEIDYTCPQTIQVGPTNLEDNWKSGGNLFFKFHAVEVRTDSTTKQRQVECSYGNTFPYLVITHRVTAGYNCTPGSSTSRSVKCISTIPHIK